MSNSGRKIMEQSQSLERRAKIVLGDRRLTMQLIGLWQAVRVDGERCPRANMFLVTLSHDLLTDCCVVERADDGEWELRCIGPTIGDRSGVYCETAKIDDLPVGSLLAAAVCDLQKAYTSQVPIIYEGEAQDKSGRKTLFRSVLLPLADPNGKIIKFVAGARQRVCAHDA